jgi:hypothetical protein
MTGSVTIESFTPLINYLFTFTFCNNIMKLQSSTILAKPRYLRLLPRNSFDFECTKIFSYTFLIVILVNAVGQIDNMQLGS